MERGIYNYMCLCVGYGARRVLRNHIRVGRCEICLYGKVYLNGVPPQNMSNQKKNQLESKQILV